MKMLTETLKLVLLEGPKTFGTYEYPDALGPYEENLNTQEVEHAREFLAWVVAQKLTYGHGNLDALWKKWQGIPDGANVWCDHVFSDSGAGAAPVWVFSDGSKIQGRTGNRYSTMSYVPATWKFCPCCAAPRPVS